LAAFQVSVSIVHLEAEGGGGGGSVHFCKDLAAACCHVRMQSLAEINRRLLFSLPLLHAATKCMNAGELSFKRPSSQVPFVYNYTNGTADVV
jgi:hypothetical protein